MRLTQEPCHDLQCWEKAAQLAIDYQRHRMHDVVTIASERLQQAGRFQAAAELHEGIGNAKGTHRYACTVCTRTPECFFQPASFLTVGQRCS